MKKYNPMQYLAIDIANNYGLDKELFETRIQWVKDNLQQLESLVDQAEEPALYYAGVLALRDAQAGKPSGYAVALDACASGLQIMAAITNCRKTAINTGLISNGTRPDIYTAVQLEMRNRLHLEEFPREPVKKAVMTTFYGSVAKPKELFGENTPELKVFYEVLSEMCPLPKLLRDYFMQINDPTAYSYEWVLPDGHTAKCDVMDIENTTVGIPSLGVEISVYKKVNKPKDRDISLAANAVHSLDAFVVRELIRRGNYNQSQLIKARGLLESHSTGSEYNQKLHECIMAYNSSKFLSLRMVEFIDESNANYLEPELKEKLINLIDETLSYSSFEVFAIHDSFKALPNHIHKVRQLYVNIFAELADSTVLKSILTQITNKDENVPMRDSISLDIRNTSEYAIC